MSFLGVGMIGIFVWSPCDLFAGLFVAGFVAYAMYGMARDMRRGRP